MAIINPVDLSRGIVDLANGIVDLANGIGRLQKQIEVLADNPSKLLDNTSALIHQKDLMLIEAKKIDGVAGEILKVQLSYANKDIEAIIGRVSQIFDKRFKPQIPQPVQPARNPASMPVSTAAHRIMHETSNYLAKIGVQKIGPETAKTELAKMQESFAMNPYENNGNSNRFDHNTFNQRIFRFMQEHGETPYEFMLGLNKSTKVDRPEPIMTNALVFQMEENVLYKPFDYGATPLRLPGPQGDSITDNPSFGCALKRQGNHILLFLDGISRLGSIVINDKVYLYEKGKKLKTPSLILKAGDTFYNWGRFIGKVGENGTILYANPDKQEDNFQAPGYNQKLDLLKQLQTERNEQRAFSSLEISAELHDSLKPGFVIPPSLILSQNPSDEPAIHNKNESIVFDLDKDVKLQRIISYFQRECHVMNYNPEQTLLRISSLVIFLMQNTDVLNMQDSCYLGDYVNTLGGVCRHRSYLFKVLADSINIYSCLILGAIRPPMPLSLNGKNAGYIQQPKGSIGVFNAGHAWIGTIINGRKLLIDPMKEVSFYLDDIPGNEHSDLLENCYGLKGKSSQRHSLA